LTVKVDVPTVPVGVPEMAPVEVLIARPVGSAPDAMAKVFVPVPPLTAMVAPAYTAFIVPAVSAPSGVVLASAGFTVMDEVVASLVGSLMLVAVTVTVEAIVPVAVSVVAGELPATMGGLTVPAPVAVNVAPEALPSFVTSAVSASVWPESSVMPVVTVENETAIRVSVIVAEADLVGSLTLVAVTTAVAVVTGLAAV
jgi:hypothetical protein